LGQLPFFIEFLKASGLYDAFISDCPLSYTSPNAPNVRDILGTLVLSVLAGHKRYAHITTIRSDRVNPELLGMDCVASEDSVRRALLQFDKAEAITWLDKVFQRTYPYGRAVGGDGESTTDSQECTAELSYTRLNACQPEYK